MMDRMDNTLSNSLTKATLAEKRVLITGTTGFLGKVLLEKIIRDVPEVAAVNLLIRPGNNYSSAFDRFRNEVLNSSVFEHLKTTRPGALEAFVNQKVHCISGEITEDQFGLSHDAYTKLAESTDAFINSAASVNFHEELDKALLINAQCLHNIADFSYAAGDIPVVQISTCYVNGFNQGIIHEEISRPKGKKIPKNDTGYYDVESVFDELHRDIALVKSNHSMPKDQKDALTELGIRQANRYGWGDTYTFTKWLGEQVLLNRLCKKTLTILRPSVVESTLSSPHPGWIEGVKVADAILLAYAKQKVSFFPARKAGIVDIIPVDLVANSVLLGLAETFIKPNRTRIYQCCSGSQNPLVVKHYVRTICEEVRLNWRNYPQLTDKQPTRKFMLVNRTVFLAMIKTLKLAYTLSDRLRLRSKSNKSRALQVVESTVKLSSIYSNYTSPKYIFNSDQLMALAQRMGEYDQVVFPVDARHIDWDHYFQKIHVAGLNKYGMEQRAQIEQDAKQAILIEEVTPETSTAQEAITKKREVA